MIDFRQLRGVMATAFDTDNIVKVYDKITTTVYAENVPCHFVITQADNPGAGEIVAEKPIPVVVYGEIYTSERPIIRDGYIIVVEKKDSAGNVLATYEGVAGMPAYRAGRMVTVMKITDIQSEEEPEPPAGFNIRVPDGWSGYYTTTDRYAIEVKEIDDGWGGVENAVVLTDIRFEYTGGKVYLEDDGFYGRLQLFPLEAGGIITFNDGVSSYQVNGSQTPKEYNGKPYVTM